MFVYHREGKTQREETATVQVLFLPVLGQFHDDVSSRGEDDEGHPQHGAANTVVSH